jgi:hypothetical protein
LRLLLREEGRCQRPIRPKSTRSILVGYARDKRAIKRGAGLDHCTLKGVHAVMKGQPVDLLDLDRCLDRALTP